MRKAKKNQRIRVKLALVHLFWHFNHLLYSISGDYVGAIDSWTKKIVHYWKKNKSNFQFLFITMNREEFKIFDDFHSDEPFLVFASVFLNIQMLLEVGFNKKLFLVMSLFRSNAFSRSFRLCLFSNVKWRILIRIINVLDWKEYAHKHISPIRQMTDDTTYFSSRLYSVVFRKFWKKRFIYQQSIANLTNYGW